MIWKRLMNSLGFSSEPKCIHIWTVGNEYIRLPNDTYLLNGSNVIKSKIDTLKLRTKTCRRCNIKAVIMDGDFTFYLKGKKIEEPYWSSIYQNHDKDNLINTVEFVREMTKDKVIQ